MWRRLGYWLLVSLALIANLPLRPLYAQTAADDAGVSAPAFMQEGEAMLAPEQMDALMDALEAAIAARPAWLQPGSPDFLLDSLQIELPYALMTIYHPTPLVEDIPPPALFAAAHQIGSTWMVYLEGTPGYGDILRAMPPTLLDPTAADILLAAQPTPPTPDVEAAAADATYSLPGFPWRAGETWRYTQDMHGGSNNGFDFAPSTTGVGKIHAADGGVVEIARGAVAGNRSAGCYVVLRRADGLRHGYVHVSPISIANLSVGQPLSAGAYLGDTTADAACPAVQGHHVHFYLFDSATATANKSFIPVGTTLNGWRISRESDSSEGVNGVDYPLRKDAAVACPPGGVTMQNGRNICTTSSLPHVAVAVGDAYEPDNRMQQARSIGANGTAQTHTIHTSGDEDWVKFTAVNGTRYTIETLNLRGGADTVIGLFYDANNDGHPDMITSNDDYGGTLASRIVWTASRSGTFYVKVRDFSSTAGGSGRSYSLRVLAQATTSPDLTRADAYEPDNVFTAAKSIRTDGSRQTHTLHVAGDEDWVRFSAVGGTRYIMETLNLRGAADTLIGLFYDANNDGHADLITSNDDYGGSLASRIVWTAPRNGTYYIKVRDYNRTRGGVGYDLRLFAGVAAAADLTAAPVTDAGPTLPLVETQIVTAASDAAGDLPGDAKLLVTVQLPPHQPTAPMAMLADEPLNSVWEDATGRLLVTLPVPTKTGVQPVTVFGATGPLGTVEVAWTAQDGGHGLFLPLLAR